MPVCYYLTFMCC